MESFSSLARAEGEISRGSQWGDGVEGEVGGGDGLPLSALLSDRAETIQRYSYTLLLPSSRVSATLGKFSYAHNETTAAESAPNQIFLLDLSQRAIHVGSR